MPVVIVNSCPKGAPMATANCPTCTALLSPKRTGTALAGVSASRRTAKSESSSLPTTVAVVCVPSAKKTVISAASLITWWLVTTWPLSSQTNPEPSPRGRKSSNWGGSAVSPGITDT